MADNVDGMGGVAFRGAGAKLSSDDVHDCLDITSSITPLVSSSAHALAVGVACPRTHA
jgi:hypothetical protein